jgi:hypothetical protein
VPKCPERVPKCAGIGAQVPPEQVPKCRRNGCPSHAGIRTAETDLEEGRAALEHLVQSSPSFADAVQGKPVRYELIHDYGTGSYLVCSKMHGLLTWASSFLRGPRG